MSKGSKDHPPVDLIRLKEDALDFTCLADPGGHLGRDARNIGRAADLIYALTKALEELQERVDQLEERLR